MLRTSWLLWFPCLRCGLVLMVGLLGTPAELWADETYTIKSKKDEKGDVFSVSQQETDETKAQFTDADGKVLKEQTEKKTTTLVYKKTILEKEKGKKPTRERREYSKAVVKVGDKEQVLPFQGKTILIHKKAGYYLFDIEGGGELTGKDAELLDKEFNQASCDDESEDFEKLIFPAKAVRVSETWKIDPDQFLKTFAKDVKEKLPVDKAKLTGTGKLVRVYKKDDKQFGVIDVAIDLPLKGTISVSKEAKAEIQPGAKMTMHIRADLCIDGTSGDGTAAMAMKMNYTAVLKGSDGKDYKFSSSGQQKVTHSEKGLPKK